MRVLTKLAAGVPATQQVEHTREEAGLDAANNEAEGKHGGITVEAKVQCEGQTGVEMEALSSVMGAALTVVDMCKAVDKGMRIDGVRVVLKEGGRSGVWKDEGWISQFADV